MSYSKQATKSQGWLNHAKHRTRMLTEHASHWEVIGHPELADHLELLEAAQLLHLPKRFFEPISSTALIPNWQPLPQDLGNIHSTVRHVNHKLRKKHPQQSLSLGRYGPSQSNHTQIQEPLNDDYAQDWELILYPQRFDACYSDLTSDALACALAYHVLSFTKKTKHINTRMPLSTLVEHARAYQLSQCLLSPQHRHGLRQIRLFTGHLCVAAEQLGFDWRYQSNGEVCINVSAKSALLKRYPNLNNHLINGWH